MAAIWGFGTGLFISDGNPNTPTWIPVTGIKEVSFPQSETDMMETTDHSTVDGTKTFEPGLIDHGEIAMVLNYDPAEPSHVMLSTLQIARTKRECKIVLPGSRQTATFTAMVRTFQISTPLDDIINAAVALKITGAVAYT